MYYQMETGNEQKANPTPENKGKQTAETTPILDKQQLQKIYDDYQVPSEEEDERARAKLVQQLQTEQSQRNKAIISLMINQGLTTPEINKLNSLI